MKTLVLDKSALQSAPKGILRRYRESFDFLLIEILLHEIGTEGLPERSSLSPDEINRLDGKIKANFQRAVYEAGNNWVTRQAAITWEIERGKSAVSAPRYPLNVIPNIAMLTEQDKESCLADDRKAEQLVKSADSVLTKREKDQITQAINRREFGKSLESMLGRDHDSRHIQQVSLNACTELAAQRGLKLSNNFCPGRDWLSYGLEIMALVVLYWRTWCNARRPLKVRELANSLHDMEYLAYVAIADGILSCDKDLLHLTWACWPEKRESIYIFEQEKHQIQPFLPEWER